MRTSLSRVRPSTKADPRNTAATDAEFVTLYPNRGSASPELWESWIHRSRVQIELLAFAASFLHDSVPNFAEHVTDRARQGVPPGATAVRRPRL